MSNLNQDLTLIVILVVLGAAAASLTAHSQFESALRVALRKTDIPPDEGNHALKSALWNPDKTAVAVAFRRPKASLIFVFLRQTNGEFLVVDVSAVESGNFGKLGSGPSRYDRFETTPVEWLRRDDGLFQVVMRTRAWASGQRYTVSEPLIIRVDGTPLWR